MNDLLNISINDININDSVSQNMLYKKIKASSKKQESLMGWIDRRIIHFPIKSKAQNLTTGKKLHKPKEKIIEKYNHKKRNYIRRIFSQSRRKKIRRKVTKSKKRTLSRKSRNSRQKSLKKHNLPTGKFKSSSEIKRNDKPFKLIKMTKNNHPKSKRD